LAIRPDILRPAKGQGKARENWALSIWPGFAPRRGIALRQCLQNSKIFQINNNHITFYGFGGFCARSLSLLRKGGGPLNGPPFGFAFMT